MARPRTRDALRQPILRLLRRGDHDGPSLVASLGINQRTLTRLVADLRADGVVIESVRTESGWRYRVIETQAEAE